MSRLIFLYQMDLPHRAVAVYTYLHDRANKNGECWPSVNTIAGDIKLSPATVRRAIKDLYTQLQNILCLQLGLIR